MSDRVLYFPYINVPDNAWFTRTVLYWDQVGAIVPSEYFYDSKPVRLEPHMRKFVEAGLVQPIAPDKYIDLVPNFADAFLAMIERYYVGFHFGNFSKSESMFRTYVQEKGSSIHIDKFGYHLASELCRLRLAEPANWPWYKVERNTANLFMAYLASVLGKVPKLNMDPITDQLSYLDVFTAYPDHGQFISSKKDAVASEFRRILLRDLLPAPARGVSAEEISEFKDKYSSQLHRFRRRIELFLLDTEIIEDTYVRDERIQHFRSELEDEIQDIQERMHERRWPRVIFGSFSGLVAAAIPGVQGLLTGDPVLAAGAAPGLITAIYAAFSGSPQQHEVLRSPLAYAAVARDRFQRQRILPPRPWRTR